MNQAPLPSIEVTTAVELPPLSERGFADLLAILERQHPDEIDRIRRGAALYLRGGLFETAETGVYLVPSGVPGQYYRASTFTCGCPDKIVRGAPRCKHVWCLTVLVAASVAARYERLSREFEPIPYMLTEAGEAALEAQAAAPGA